MCIYTVELQIQEQLEAAKTTDLGDIVSQSHPHRTAIHRELTDFVFSPVQNVANLAPKKVDW